MSISNPNSHEHERQYRPTYNSLPKSGVPPNFGVPISSSMQAAMRERRRTSMKAFGENEVDFHSAATVATSNLTASASGKFRHSMNRQVTPTRIPTPTRAAPRDIRSQQASYYTADSDSSDPDSPSKQTPKAKAPSRSQFVVDGEQFIQVLPSLHHKDSENTPKVGRLIGPIYPDLTPAPPLSRARTFQVLSSITNSFSLSSLHKVSSQLSLHSNLKNAARSSSGPATFFSRNSRPGSPTQPNHDLTKPEGVDLRKVRTGMPQSYWAGRYRTLDDKFRNEHFESEYLNSPMVFETLKVIEERGDLFERDGDISDSDEIRCRRVFAELETHCKTLDAKKSLWNFQQSYARSLKCQRLLPVGGTFQEKENMLSRAGRFFIRSRAGGVLGDKRVKSEKKTDVKLFGKKGIGRPSLLSKESTSYHGDEVMEALRDRGFCWEAGGAGM